MHQVIAFPIYALCIHNGSLSYGNYAKATDLNLTRIDTDPSYLVGSRLLNMSSVAAQVEAHSLNKEDGQVTLKASVIPWLEVLHFPQTLALARANLPALNQTTQHLEALAFAAGRFDGFLELKVRNGQLDCQLEPLVHGLQVARFRGSDKRSSDMKVSKASWKAVTPAGEALLVNNDTGSLAARIPMRGHLDGPKTTVWTVIGTLI